jgi:hypothetical protein
VFLADLTNEDNRITSPRSIASSLHCRGANTRVPAACDRMDRWSRTGFGAKNLSMGVLGFRGSNRVAKASLSQGLLSIAGYTPGWIRKPCGVSRGLLTFEDLRLGAEGRECSGHRTAQSYATTGNESPGSGRNVFRVHLVRTRQPFECGAELVRRFGVPVILARLSNQDGLGSSHIQGSRRRQDFLTDLNQNI